MLLIIRKKATKEESRTRNREKILDIAMNLTRIGNWAADDYQAKQKRIELFLDQTTEHINSIDRSSFLDPFKKTFENFLREY